MSRGETVTVPAVAREAGVSVATAYRYYSEAETLRIEAGLELEMGPSGDFVTMMKDRVADIASVAERAIIAHRIMVEFVRRNDASYRLFIAKGHEQLVRDRKALKSPPRGGRRIPLMDLAIEPLRAALGPERATALRTALISATGPEPYFVLTDVARMADGETDAVTETVIRDLVAAHLARAGLTERS